MAVDRVEQNRDITLAPNTYLYLQNVGKGGLITVHRGPTAVTQTGQDEPVRYDEATQTFKRCRLEEAVCQFKRANEGDYVILENPSDDGGFPTGNAQASKELKQGRRIVIPGPWSEALWPSQSATVVEGHKLRTNQYLIATIYNADEAEKNWDKTVVKPVTPSTEETKTTTQKKGLPRPESFAVGSRIVIRGTDVSFYIPCTGVQVKLDEKGNYVREAVTLEQLEYAILIDENGKKEYPRGPAVVFPKPTQIFATDSEKRRKFKPLELNSINGIHLKVTADFTGPDIEEDPSKEREFKEGEELFVTGKTLAIYYPREELAIISYGEGNNKHYSTAIPVGEGRYIINRESGEIKLLRGPKMFLADPRTEIPVRRVLSDDECALWYPGNQMVVEYNRELAQAMLVSPSGRSGAVSEGDYRKIQAHKLAAGGMTQETAYLSSSGALAQQEVLQNFRREEAGEDRRNIVRQTAYTPPRTLTLNTKFDGVPRIEVWPGYAVLVVGADGSRKVVEGPQVVLLEYHEKLGFMTLSTGKPKTTDKLMKTAYLCTMNNQVSDIVPFESADHVKGKVKISLRVNFEGEDESEKLKWFSVDNYVKLLTDHVRSMVAGLAKKKRIGDFKADYINLTRDAIFGAKNEKGDRPGLFFEMINLRVYEVEVLELTLDDANISKLLDQVQQESVQASIELERLSRKLETTKEKERISQEEAVAASATQKRKNDLQREVIATQITLTLAQVEAELQRLEGEKKKKAEQEALEYISHKAELERSKETADQAAAQSQVVWNLENEKLSATTKAAVERFQAAKDGLHEVLVMMGREDMAVRLAEAMNIERFLTGDSASNSISNILAISPILKGFFDQSTAAGEKYQQKRMERMFPNSPSIPVAAGVGEGKK
jgi:major vault protein